MKQDLLRISSLTPQEIEELISRALALKKKPKKGRPYHPLQGKTLGLLFEKHSTRTRVSFEVGMHQLGGHSLYLNWNDTQLGRDESVEDTARVLSRYLDGIVIRTYAQKTVETFAHHASIPVINGLTDQFHPCQILSDLMTIVEKKGGYQHLKIAYIGDGNNIANSWIDASLTLGFSLALAFPPGYEADQELLARVHFPSASPIEISSDPFAAARNADIINTDTWVSMGQEREYEQRLEAFKPYQLNSALLKVAKKEVLVMHCLPAHRGQEITHEVAESSHSIIFDQAENRLHLQKAILAKFLTHAEKER